MRISDWSSDVCSSDLVALGERRELAAAQIVLVPAIEAFDLGLAEVRIEGLRLTLDLTGEGPLFGSLQKAIDGLAGEDRKSVVSGKSVSVRVDLGGRRIIKKKTHDKINRQTTTQ